VTPREDRRAPAPLPDGPYHVPISTIDWLVSRESPAARYVALRDLLHRPARDLDLKRARQALPRDPWTRDSLAALRQRTLPGLSAEELSRRYEGGLWLTLFLVETGCDASFPAIRHAGDLLFAAWERTFVELSRGHEVAVDLPSFTAVCRCLALMGHAADRTILAAAEYVARSALLGRAATSKTLLLFSVLPPGKRSPLVVRATEFLRERAVGAEIPGAVPTAPGRAFLRAGFPTGAETDLVELLWALALTAPDEGEEGREGNLARGLSLLLARADHRGRWKLDRALPDGLPVSLERAGEMSRWVTMRALVVLQRFLGLTIETSRAVGRPAVLR
jgi:hypothetical protein